MKKFITTLLMVFYFSVSLTSVHAQSTNEPRKILALYQYNPKAIDQIYQSDIHRHLEMVLNHLGLTLDFREVNDPLPQNLKAQGYRGIITWYYDNYAVKDPDVYCRWLAQQMDDGLRWIPLHLLGILQKGTTNLSPVCEKTLHTLGIEYRGEVTEDPLYLEVVQKDPKYTEFERPITLTDPMYYLWFRPIPQSGIKIITSLRRTDIEDSESALTFLSPHGGLVSAGLDIYSNTALGKIKFIFNPFTFFNEALNLQGLPRPDVTSRNGRRIFMTHIDGDGIFNISQTDRKSYAGEIIAKLMQKYSMLPFSASIIAGYLDMPEYSGKRIDNLYRQIFAADNVEAAAHGYAHPLVWTKNTFSLNIPDYQYDPHFEVVGALEKVRALLKRLNIDKNVSLYFWTGNCLPSAEQTAFAKEGNALNINGGDSTFYASRDSYAFLSPLGILRGEVRQIYAPFANENIYTNLWRSRYYGFLNSIDSFKNTESPIRIKPIDVYYHYYSGERTASMKALEEIYAWASSQEIAPTFVSDYLQMANDVFNTSYHKIADGWHVETTGKLPTIRFDESNLNVDLSQSRGVIGFRKYQHSLYVHLDANKSHDIILTTAANTLPNLSDASFAIDDFQRTNHGFTFNKKGWLTSIMTINGLKPSGTYTITENDKTTSVHANPDGTLVFRFEKIEKQGDASRVILSESF